MDFDNVIVQKNKLIAALAALSTADAEFVIRALDFATEAHQGQERDGGTPYIIHPIRVCATLITNADITDKEILAAALLHDVLEDCDVTKEDIAEAFSPRTAELTKALTRPRVEPETRESKIKSKQAKFTWYRDEASVDAVQIKCADLYDNMQSWQHIPAGHPSEKKFERWCGEVNEWYIVLAKKAGLAFETLFQELIAAYKKDSRFSSFLT